MKDIEKSLMDMHKRVFKSQKCPDLMYAGGDYLISMLKKANEPFDWVKKESVYMITKEGIKELK